MSHSRHSVGGHASCGGGGGGRRLGITGRIAHMLLPDRLSNRCNRVRRITGAVVHAVQIFFRVVGCCGCRCCCGGGDRRIGIVGGVRRMAGQYPFVVREVSRSGEHSAGGRVGCGGGGGGGSGRTSRRSRPLHYVMAAAVLATNPPEVGKVSVPHAARVSFLPGPRAVAEGNTVPEVDVERIFAGAVSEALPGGAGTIVVDLELLSHVSQLIRQLKVERGVEGDRIAHEGTQLLAPFGAQTGVVKQRAAVAGVVPRLIVVSSSRTSPASATGGQVKRGKELNIAACR
mmetsp:Transcript_20990/g.35970  ORF Transcript_20990/g.35970 Transcript_20990/m.35970 type:complete len:287 (+) Transcript_20990:346-1206(+)